MMRVTRRIKDRRTPEPGAPQVCEPSRSGDGASPGFGDKLSPLPTRFKVEEPRRVRSRAGFTLIEILLAIMIAATLLAAALYLYQQAMDLRAQLMQETERLSVTRLLLDRLTTDLRGGFNQSSSAFALSGSATSLQIVKTDLPTRAAWNPGPFGRVASPESDLRLVTYTLASHGEGTNVAVTGLDRTEKPLIEPRNPPPSDTTDTTDTTDTSAPAESQVAASSSPLIEEIRFLRFRYWDGAAWRESWTGSQLPSGVEVSLGWEALPEDALVEEYPYELFRRVVYLPASITTTTSTNEFDEFPILEDAALGSAEPL